jgi:NAD(P)-dependent dehydrogenase (short-subunit alcohol dehydrogenase family)
MSKLRIFWVWAASNRWDVSTASVRTQSGAASREHTFGRSDQVTDALRSYSLEGKTAFVTGAAGGIGSAITERLCGLGARVILADMVDRVESAAKEWTGKGYKTSALKLDVTNSAAVEKAAADLNKQFGHVDILVANAGVAYESPTETHSDDDWHRCLKINLDGVFYCVRSFGKRMVERKSGSIVCISSIAGVKAVRPELHAGYDVSKAGVAHLCRVVGVEWATHNVRVNAVGPGYTETDMLKKVGLEQPAVMKAWIDDIPMKRLLQPAEIASTIGFLVSDAASGITGQVIMTDAGYSAA